MYSLYLLDGTVIDNLQKVGNNAFEQQGCNYEAYRQLNDRNLSLALLCEGELLREVYIDYARLNFYCDGTTRFKIAPAAQVYRIPNSEIRKRRKRNGVKSLAAVE